MFDKTWKPDQPYSKGDYSLSLPVDSDWYDKSERVLLIIETIDSEDLAKSTLLYDKSLKVVRALLNYSIKQAKLFHGFKRSTTVFAALNFNNRKFMDQPPQTWGTFRQKFAKRVHKAVEEMDPTVILFFGNRGFQACFPDVEYAEKKRGWVHLLKAGGKKRKVVNTLDLQPLYTPKRDETGSSAGEDDDDDDGDQIDKDVYGKSNLLFYVSRHVVNGLVGRMLYDLSDVKANPKYVDTIDKFNDLWEKIKTHEGGIAIDTETRNGSVNHNAIHTIQFAFSTKRGYVLPLYHPQTPFTADELEYIHKRLRRFFMAQPGEYPVEYLIMQYSMFDTRIIRTQFDIPVIFHPIWEITAGEWMLDENLKYLVGSPFDTPHGNLEQIFFTYGNDHYKQAAFAKEDRANAAMTQLDNPAFIEYGAMDVQSIHGICRMQRERAKNLMVGGKSFYPYYMRLVTKQMSNTVHVLGHMKQKGSAVDKGYLALLKSKTSPLLKLIDDVKKQIFKTTEAKQANSLILKESSGQSSNKGLFNREQFVLNLGKADHKEILFFTTMGLKPVSFTAKEKKPQVNTTFIAAYKREQPIVELFGRYQKMTKLWSTYVKGWWNKIQDSVDSKEDWRLRPDYGFFDVVTGRLNSKNPSLQQTPTRGAESKYIKRAFRAPPGTILVIFDYSAHEVRVWSFVGFDKVLASVFRIGQELRQKLRLATNPEEIDKIFKELKQRGDVHILNVKRFFNQWVDKEHPLRDAIKSVVFGVIYQKSAKSLAKDIKTNEVNNLKNKIDEINKKESKTKEDLEALTQAEKGLKALKIDDKVELSKSIMAKLFSEFPKGSQWLEWSKNHAVEHYYTYSPLGMRRNLFGIMTGIPQIISAMQRRAANSPIQGLASQIGITAARLYVLHLHAVLMKFGYITKKTKDLPADINKAVHDAIYTDVPYLIILIQIHILQWTATYGVTKYYLEEFDFKFTIEPEIEIAFGATEDKIYKWNFTNAHLKESLLKVLQDQVAIGTLKDDPEATLKTIYREYKKNVELRDYLETNYPILGVAGNLL